MAAGVTGQWCKLGAGYYRDPAVVRAGEDAEVLFVRGLAYCAEHGTDGRIPKAAIPFLTPTRSRARAAALVRERLWLDDGDDHLVRSWGHWQEGFDALGLRRRKDRERKAAARREERDRGSKVVRGQSADTSAEVRTTEVEVEEEEDVLRTSPVQAVVAAWVDAMTAAGVSHKGLQARVGKQAKNLLADGVPLATLLEAARRAGSRGFDDLAKQLQIDSRPNVTLGAPTNDRFADHRELIEMLATKEAAQ